MVRPPLPELEELLAGFEPNVRAIALEARAFVLARAPGAHELIYDAYNALSLAYSFDERLGGAFCHVALYRHHVNLGFNRGAELDDPAGLLQGSGTRIRHLRLEEAADLQAVHVDGFLQAAIALAGRDGKDGQRPPQDPSQARSILMPTSGKKRRS